MIKMKFNLWGEDIYTHTRTQEEEEKYKRYDELRKKSLCIKCKHLLYKKYGVDESMWGYGWCLLSKSLLGSICLERGEMTDPVLECNKHELP